MPAIRNFVDPAALREFQREIPRILSDRIGRFLWNDHNSTFGVGGNTFRAYTGWRNSPSVTFRSWAHSATERIVLKTESGDINSQELFDEWHRRLARSLQRSWLHSQGSELSVAHKYKLVDLYVKWLTAHKLPNQAVLERLVAFGHCALDRQTLALANVHLSSAIPMNKPSMGHVKTEATYAFCQGVIGEYCELAGGTPVLFDYFAWRPGA